MRTGRRTGPMCRVDPVVPYGYGSRTSMQERFIAKIRRCWFLVVCTGVGLLLLGGFLLTEHLIFQGAPYEDWDEIMAYNVATPISLTTRLRNTTYGSVEECKFWIAKFVYERFDPIGRKLSPLRWSNNVMSSYLRPDAVLESKSFDFTYARGILDRRPFFIARYITLIGSLLLSAALCSFWLVRFRYDGLFLIAPLLWFVLTDLFSHFAALAYPSAWNALLAITVFVVLMDVIERRRFLGLYVASAFAALGANSKIDFLLVGAPIVLTWLLADFNGGTLFRRWIRPALICVVSFIGVLLLTNPRLLYAAPLVISEQYRLFHSVSSGSVNLGYNWAQLVTAFVADSIGPPWNAAKLHSLSNVTGVGVCLLFPVAVVFSSNLGVRRKLATLAILSLFYLFLWGVPLFLATIAYDRYFLSGIGVAMISLGYAGRYFWKGTSRVSRCVGLLIPCACLVFYFGRAKELASDAVEAKSQMEAGLDRTVSRNKAVLKMIELINDGRYPKQVVIDQHGYTDIRAFLEHGISVTLINAFNYQREIEKLGNASAPILGLYVPGEGRGPKKWSGTWNDEERSRYDTYLKYLSRFGTIAKFGFKPMLLLDWAPPDSDDAVVVFEIPSGTGPSGTRLSSAR